MNYWQIRRNNPNTRHRTLNTASVRSTEELKGLVKGGDVAAQQANLEHAELVADDAERQARRNMMRVIRASKLVNGSRDKRRRKNLEGVTKDDFKAVRALKLTRTAKIRKKVRKTSHPRAH